MRHGLLKEINLPVQQWRDTADTILYQAHRVTYAYFAHNGGMHGCGMPGRV